MQKTRLIAVIDLEVPDYSTAGQIEDEWGKFVGGFYSGDQTEGVKIIQAQSMMGARRGAATGPISNIVFRN